MNFRLLAVLLSICLSGHEAKRVEVKTSKERPLGRHFAKQQIQGNTDSLIESDSQPLTAGKNAQASEDELVTDFVPSTEEPGVPPASAPAQKVAGVNSSPVKSRGSFLSSIVGSLFGSNQVAASKLASGTGEKDAFSSAPASTSESSCASETETALGVPQASGADTVHVTSAAGSGRAAEVSAEGDATAAPPRASAEDAERALAMDLERRRQTLMHKQKLEIAEMEVKKLKEVEEEIQRKKNAAEADLKASLEAGARQAQDVESELSRMRAQTEVELAETVAAQRRSMNEIKQMELQKLRDLDEEVEKKRVAAEAFMNQVRCAPAGTAMSHLNHNLSYAVNATARNGIGPSAERRRTGFVETEAARGSTG